MIDLFTSIPNINKEIKPVKIIVQKKKSLFSSKNKDEIIPEDNTDKIEVKKKKFDKYDPKFDQAYENFHKNNNKETVNSEEELVKNLNLKLPSYTPDTKIDDLEFLTEKLCTKDELKDFYDFTKINNYNFRNKIKEWCEKLHSLVLKEIDDIGDDNENKDDDDVIKNTNENNDNEDENKK